MGTGRRGRDSFVAYRSHYVVAIDHTFVSREKNTVPTPN